MQKPNGCIAWSGDSLLDGSPIVLLLTGLELPSHNTKTGAMVQSYILHRNIPPIEALTSDRDEAVCGDCPLKREICYVDLRPIGSIFRKYIAGGYPLLDNKILARLKRRHLRLRLGSYGDPTAVPFEAWLPLLTHCDGHTGYTHQWRSCDQRWRDYLMASVERPEDVTKANERGWRTFRVKLPSDPLLKGEIACANSQDDTVQCEDCGLCNGRNNNSLINIADDIHGLTWKRSNFRNFITA